MLREVQTGCVSWGHSHKLVIQHLGGGCVWIRCHGQFLQPLVLFKTFSYKLQGCQNCIEMYKNVSWHLNCNLTFFRVMLKRTKLISKPFFWKCVIFDHLKIKRSSLSAKIRYQLPGIRLPNTVDCEGFKNFFTAWYENWSL